MCGAMTRYVGGKACQLTGYEIRKVDDIIFRRDATITMDGKDVNWSDWKKTASVPANAILVEERYESYGNGLAF